MGSTSENIQINLKLNGLDEFKNLKDLNSQILADQRALTKLDKTDPGYSAAAQRLRDLKSAQTAWRKEIYGTKDEVKGFFADFKKGFEEVKNIAQGVTIGTLISMGIRGAISSIQELVSGSKAAYKEAVLGQAQMDAALKSTGGVAGETKDHLNDMAESLMNLTGIDDDTITRSENLLLTFTNIRGAIYDQALPAIVDMTAAMNGGNVTMETIQATTLQVGKALNDPIAGMTALKKVGVSFSESQKDTIKQLLKTNDVAGAQKLILSELQKEFGGVAKAMADNDVGVMQKHETRIGNIKENIGAWLTSLDVLKAKASDSFLSVLENITSVKSQSEKLTDEFHEQTARVNDLTKNTAPLLDRYDELKKKAVLNKVEQAELKKIIGQIAEQMPSAISQWDKLGNAMAVNTKVGRENIEIQKSLAKYINKDALKENGDELEEILAKRDALVKSLQAGKVLETTGTGGMLGGQTSSIRKMTDDELKQIRVQIANLNNAVAEKHRIIKGLKGETVDEKPKTKPDEPFTIGGEDQEELKKAQEEADRIREKETESLQKFLDKQLEAVEKGFQERLSVNDAEIAAIAHKYDKERAEADKSIKDKTKLRAALVAIDNAEAADYTAALERQAKAEAEIQKKTEKEAAEKHAKFLEDKASAEEKVFQSTLSDQQLEQLSVDQHFEELIKLADQYGIDSTKLYEKWTEAKLAVFDKSAETELKKTEELEQKKRDAMEKGAQLVSDTIFTIGANQRKAEEDATLKRIDDKRQKELENEALTQEQKDAINRKYDEQVRKEKLRAWRADQRAAIAQALINGAIGVTAAWKNPFAAPFTIPLIIATTAAQVGVIAAQKAPQFSKGVAMVPDGPSHAEGGINLVNNKTGAVIGEMEGGEPFMILSKETRRNNGPLISELLYNSQYRNGARVSVNHELAGRAMQQFRTGGIQSADPARDGSGIAGGLGLNALIMEVRDLKAAVQEEKRRPIDFNTRVHQQYLDKIKFIEDAMNG